MSEVCSAVAKAGAEKPRENFAETTQRLTELDSELEKAKLTITSLADELELLKSTITNHKVLSLRLIYIYMCV